MYFSPYKSDDLIALAFEMYTALQGVVDDAIEASDDPLACQALHSLLKRFDACVNAHCDPSATMDNPD